jgi:glutamate-1-semialdehyde 2,1-aminomutase
LAQPAYAFEPVHPYAASEAWLERARATVPLGAQTFSKSVTQYPYGVSPYFAERAQGCRLWDIDGNRYLDFINALCAVTLGYGDPDVTAAAERQLRNGVVFSLSSRLEAEVAERICALVPCAEAVRFGKNGSDATAGAIRVARAYTGRDRVLMCGYHGWSDWSIGTTARNKGVPKAVSDLTTVFPYDDLPALSALLDAHDREVAAIILEPMNVRAPSPGYLQGVRALADRHGCVLVFDETITGFRFANGGAQALFGVTPDLATFGKGLANGFPLSAVAGRREIMAEMEEVFFSFTMGGEAVSLAAAKAVLDKLVRQPVIATLRARGGELVAGVENRIDRAGADGLPVRQWGPELELLNFAAPEGIDHRTRSRLWLQEMFARGVLTLGNPQHELRSGEADVDRAAGRLRGVSPCWAEAVARATLSAAIAARRSSRCRRCADDGPEASEKLGLGSAQSVSTTASPTPAAARLTKRCRHPRARPSGVRCRHRLAYGEAESDAGRGAALALPVPDRHQDRAGRRPGDGRERRAGVAEHAVAAVRVRSAGAFGEGPGRRRRAGAVGHAGAAQGRGALREDRDQRLRQRRSGGARPAVSPDVMQLPVSLLDQSLIQNGALETLAGMGVEVHLRSIFLQGLLFVPLERLPGRLGGSAARLKRVRLELAEAGVDPVTAAVRFALDRREAACAVVGVTTLEEFDDVLAAARAPTPDLDWAAMALDDPVTLDPRRWAA